MLRMFMDLHETNSNVIEWYLKLRIVFGNLDCVFQLNDLVWGLNRSKVDVFLLSLMCWQWTATCLMRTTSTFGKHSWRYVIRWLCAIHIALSTTDIIRSWRYAINWMCAMHVAVSTIGIIWSWRYAINLLEPRVSICLQLHHSSILSVFCEQLCPTQLHNLKPEIFHKLAYDPWVNVYITQNWRCVIGFPLIAVCHIIITVSSHFTQRHHWKSFVSVATSQREWIWTALLNFGYFSVRVPAYLSILAHFSLVKYVGNYSQKIFCFLSLSVIIHSFCVL